MMQSAERRPWFMVMMWFFSAALKASSDLQLLDPAANNGIDHSKETWLDGVYHASVLLGHPRCLQCLAILLLCVRRASYSASP